MKRNKYIIGSKWQADGVVYEVLSDTIKGRLRVKKNGESMWISKSTLLTWAYKGGAIEL